MELIPLPDFRNQLPGLSLPEKIRILEQAQLILEANYVHLPDKRRLTAFDPVAACRLLRADVQNNRGIRLSPAEDELRFHETLLDIFYSIRDRHTSYLLPEPLAHSTAFLPFAVDIAIDRSGSEVAIVTELLPGLGVQPDFLPGVQVTHWNGVPINRLLRLGPSEERRGAPARAVRRSSLAPFSPRELTVRPLRTLAPPAEDWVVVGYLDATGRRREVRFEWQVSTGETTAQRDASAKDAAEAVDPGARATAASAADIGVHWSPVGADTAAASDRARAVETDYGVFGHLFIPTFATSTPLEFVGHLQSVLETLPAAGLIVDVRGNTGGSLPAAIGLVQLLSTDPVPLILAQMRATTENLLLCHTFVDAFGDSGLEGTSQALRDALEIGAEFTPLQPLGRRIVQEVNRPYPGPVIVVFDGFSYSATDVFAALFHDQGIGPTLSTRGPTGGGGANVWSHDLLCELSELNGSDLLRFRSLPRQASFTVAMRRLYRPGSRQSVGETAAIVAIEDNGIVPDRMHRSTRSDVLESFPDVLNAAASTLDQLPKREDRR
jgi:hypothetical protein